MCFVKFTEVSFLNSIAQFHCLFPLWLFLYYTPIFVGWFRSGHRYLGYHWRRVGDTCSVDQLVTQLQVSLSPLGVVQPSLCRDGFQECSCCSLCQHKRHSMKSPSQRLYQEMKGPHGTYHSKAKNNGGCPGWCGSVDWTPACAPKGHGFNSQSGHMPGVQARSPVAGTRGATTHWCFSPSLSLSLPLSLKINK